MLNKLNKFIRQFSLIVASAIIYILLSAAIAYAEDSCSLSIADSWRNKFPFDIVVGSVGSTDYFSVCPEFMIFGETFKACSVRTIAYLVKDIFVIRVAIGALLSL